MKTILLTLLLFMTAFAQTLSRLSATATLTYPTMAQSVCNDQVITLLGAVPNDEVYLGAPPNLAAGFLPAVFVSVANTVTVRLCKITSGTAITPTPNPAVWRVTVVR